MYTLRLGRDDLEALHRRAAYVGLAPSVLARNLLRRSLVREPIPDYSELIEDLERVTARLRALAP